MIVVDASAGLSALLNDGPARRSLANQQLHAPHLIDVEITSALRRQVATRHLSADTGWALLEVWRRLGLTRYPVHGLLDRVWELRDNLSAYDASYVALAESLDCDVVTADVRLGRAPGVHCPVRVVPR
ncbi:MAG: PIN domain-containing protein [Acidimicrobiales bacterium]